MIKGLGWEKRHSLHIIWAMLRIFKLVYRSIWYDLQKILKNKNNVKM